VEGDLKSMKYFKLGASYQSLVTCVLVSWLASGSTYIFKDAQISKEKYCNVLGGSIHDVTLLHSKSQYTTVKHSQKLFEHTYTSDPHGLSEHSFL
jgi:hypothetical protein